MTTTITETTAVPVETTVPVEALIALQAEHQLEIAKLMVRLLRYRALLEEHGITAPESGEAELLEMWRRCRAVVKAAHECVAMLGPGKELLEDSWVIR